MRFFNNAGPVNCKKHYCLPPLQRFDTDEILLLIEQEKYFVLHAPRQTGKTTWLLALQEHLNREGQYHCLYFNVEVAQAARENIEQGMQAILAEMAEWAVSTLDDAYIESIWRDVLAQNGGNVALNKVLTLWARRSDKPLVIFIDEIDSLTGDTLISVLRQLRSGYARCPADFPQSVVLCGVRDVRDYRLHTDSGKAAVSGGSPFNIKAESLRMDNFKRMEMENLYRQHTQETGQIFSAQTLALAWELTQGQPWLINALAHEACFKMQTGRDRSIPITAEILMEAKERLIQRRETHLDQLAHKLREERVRRVVAPILQGEELDRFVRPDDIQYVIDLGIAIRGPEGLQIANAVYREIIPRELSFITQVNFESTIQPSRYLATDGRLDMRRLLSDFQQFFREHSEHWVDRFDYKEAGPQLLLQAFLQCIVNSGGRIEREYGLGRKRTDLLVIRPYGENKVQKAVIELKIRYASLERTIKEGVEQTWFYMDKCGSEDAHLVIFDRTADKPWEEKIFVRTRQYRGHVIQVWGM